MTDAEPAEHDSLLGTRIDGRYSVHSEIGRGGMGIVYDGVHDDLGRPVAIKVLNLAWASDPTAVARFLREARTASSFSHPNIVDVTDLGRLPDGRPYLIMPKITGTDLTAMLTESGAQPAKRVAHLLVGVAAALDVIHMKGFVHRDIKPENLMYVVREDGTETVMLLDFGIAAAVMSNEPRLTGQGAIFGTPQFMPPEVCNGGMPDARGDVYALATVAFELITGVLPFGDDNMMRVLTAKLTTDAPTLSVASGVPFPAELEQVIARGLARDPAERYAHASDFISAMQTATDHAPVSWRSGVLRPSTRSAAHPVGSYPGAHSISSWPPGTRSGSGRPGSGRPGSGRPGSGPPIDSDAAAVTQRTPSQPRRPPSAPQRQHVPAQPAGHDEWTQRRSEQEEWERRESNRDAYGRPSAGNDYARHPSERDYGRPSARDEYRRNSSDRDYAARPSARDAYGRQPNQQEHWAARAAAEDPWGRPATGLGAGLRVSERQRDSRTLADQPSGGKRVAALLGVAALLLGFLWYRHNRGLGLDGRDAILPPSAAELQRRAATTPGPNRAAAEPLPSNGTNANPNAPAPIEVPANALPTEHADAPALNPATPAAALPGPTGVEAAADTPPAQATPEVTAHDEHAAAIQVAQPSDPPNALPGVAAPVAAIPSAATHPAAQLPAAKPNHPGAVHPTQPAAKPPATPSAIGAEPPAPRDESVALVEGDVPAAPSAPVLKVEEQEPPPAEELPDLPVRSPESEAAQLAKDASTALLAGEVGHAIELLREATRLDPDQSLAWRTMGLAFERSGDTQAALAAYRQYIRLAPHGPQADMVRERMRALDQQ